MNGPVKMYSLPQIVRRDTPVELPTCMYRLNSIHSNCTNAVAATEERPAPDISHQKNSQLTGMAALELRQERILKQLEELKDQMFSIRQSLRQSGPSVVVNTATNTMSVNVDANMVSDIVINVDPLHPPYSLLLVKKLWVKSANLCVQYHTHSSIDALPENTRRFCEELSAIQPQNGVPKINVRLIWKDVGINNMELLVATVPILGECNFLRYLSRVTSSLNYDESNYEIDSFLDISYGILNSRTKTERAQVLQQINKKLGKSEFLFGNTINVADIALYSAVKQSAGAGEVNVNLTQWMQKCEKM